MLWIKVSSLTHRQSCPIVSPQQQFKKNQTKWKLYVYETHFDSFTHRHGVTCFSYKANDIQMQTGYSGNEAWISLERRYNETRTFPRWVAHRVIYSSLVQYDCSSLYERLPSLSSSSSSAPSIYDALTSALWVRDLIRCWMQNDGIQSVTGVFEVNKEQPKYRTQQPAFPTTLCLIIALMNRL